MNTPDKNQTNTTVYISNLSYERDRNGLRSIFSTFGQILNIKIVVEPSTNQSRGMAFVEMATAAQAKAAIEGIDGQIIDGRTAKAKYATPLRSGSISKFGQKAEAKKIDKDLTFKATQLAKKARNDMKRKSNPFDFSNQAPKVKTPRSSKV